MDSAKIDTSLDVDEAKEYSLYRLYYSASRSRSELVVALAELRSVKAKLARQSLDLARTEGSVRAALMAVPEAKRQVRNQFSYRIGNAITKVRSASSLIRLPATLLEEHRTYKAQKNLPVKPIVPAEDFESGRSYLADRLPRYVRHAGGRGGVTRVTGRVIFSGGDPHQSVHLRLRSLGAASGAEKNVPMVVKDGEFSISFSSGKEDVGVTFFASGEYPAVVNVRSIKVVR